MTLLTIIIALGAISQAAEPAKEKPLTKREAFCSRQFDREQVMLSLENLTAQEKARKFIESVGNMDKCLHEKETTK